MRNGGIALGYQMDGRRGIGRVRSAPQVSFFTLPRICLNTPFESFLSGPTVFGYEIAQEYPPRVSVSRLAQRLRYIGLDLSVRSRRKGPWRGFQHTYQ